MLVPSLSFVHICRSVVAPGHIYGEMQAVMLGLMYATTLGQMYAINGESSGVHGKFLLPNT